MPDSILVAMSALQVHRRAMEVTSHNIANATTPGYSRQRAELSASTPEDGAPGQLGRGVDLLAVRRDVDRLLFDRLRQTDSELGRLESIKENLQAVEGLFKEPGETGLSAVTNALFASFEDLSNNPESTALRSAVVQQLQTWTATISSLADRLATYRDDLRTDLENRVASVNDLTRQIAELNRQIRSQVVGGNSPSDLMDRREGLIRELSKHLELTLRYQGDGTLYVDSGGHLLVGQDNPDQVRLASTVTGGLILLSRVGSEVRVTGGAVAAGFSLHNLDLPGIQAQLDTMATTLAREMNAVHAVGNSQAHRAQGYTGLAVIPPFLAGEDLDAAALEPTAAGGPGIIAAYRPVFTDATGADIPRNLTINVFDPASGLAVKHVLRYDPSVGDGGRSLDDLVSAINSGHGGGFSLHPPAAGGVAGLSARKTPVDGGFRLELLAAQGRSVDFSPALDLRPSATVWTGGAVTVAGSSAAPLPVARLTASVEGGGTVLRLSYRDPATGASVSLGTAAIPSGGAVAVAGFSVTTPAGAYRDGDRFAVELDALGAVAGGPHTETATWAAADAGVTIRGRYTGGLGFDPTRPWSMRVVTPGVVGASASTPSPGNPPVVEFTYYTGSPTSPTMRTVVRTLDQSLPPGSPVQIAEGVFATFGAGSLSVAGNHLDFIVDGQPDQAGLLSALGINGMLAGSNATSLRVDHRLLADPSQFEVGSTRAEGDNLAIRGLLGLRQAKLFSNRSFALDDYYMNNLSAIGVRIQQADRMQENQEALKGSLEGRRQEVSGVSIDEEVGALILQQQAYSAAARVVSIARENISTLLDLLR